MNTRYVVVGAGLVAWQLARRGHEVTVLERTTPANREGSSHGSSRIFRYGYEFYAALVAESRTEWDELERQADQRLITPTGSLDFGAGRSLAKLAVVFEKLGVEHELLDRTSARRRWPQFGFDTEVLWHPAADVIDAESTVLAMIRLAEATGAHVESGWPVMRVERAGTRHRVLSEDGRVAEAERVVVTVGGWLPDLLGDLSLPGSFLDAFPPLQVTQPFCYRDEYGPWPAFIDRSPEICVYGLPGGRDAGKAGQKVAEYNGGHPIASAARQTGTVDPANRERMIAYVARTLPGLDPTPYAEATCLFTSTPTQDFVIDEVDGITIASPCSGHGAKFAPLLGRIIANVATGTAPPPDRFKVKAR